MIGSGRNQAGAEVGIWVQFGRINRINREEKSRAELV